LKEGAHGGTTGFPMLNRLPIYVFALADGNIRKVVQGERVGTIVSTP
jgi:uridylate kinase